VDRAAERVGRASENLTLDNSRSLMPPIALPSLETAGSPDPGPCPGTKALTPSVSFDKMGLFWGGEAQRAR